MATAASARILGLKCRIIVPKLTSDKIKARIELEGAKVEMVGEEWNDAHNHAINILKECKSSYYVHPFDDPVVWSGHSAMIDEITEDLSTTPSMIVCCCGGGGLSSGVIQGMRRHEWTSVPLLVMETNGADSLNRAVKAGTPVKPVMLDSITSIAKGLGALAILPTISR